ncbi:MAG: site-specific integrase [Erysipelotrichales bacterium]|nr:site-specific integrase [Erysipelotrichales bacterium]
MEELKNDFCGLTKHDLDIENHSININHQLLKDKNGYYVNESKTKSGIRKVLMSDETEKAFKRVLKRKQKPMIKEIDSYRHFLFLLESGYPTHSASYKTLLIRMIKKYNKTHDVLLPHITPHTLRHTFCTKLAQNNINLKNLQYIMGYSNIAITHNLYAHASEVGANKETRSMIS